MFTDIFCFWSSVYNCIKHTSVPKSTKRMIVSKIVLYILHSIALQAQSAQFRVHRILLLKTECQVYFIQVHKIHIQINAVLHKNCCKIPPSLYPKIKQPKCHLFHYPNYGNLNSLIVGCSSGLGLSSLRDLTLTTCLWVFSSQLGLKPAPYCSPMPAPARRTFSGFVSSLDVNSSPRFSCGMSQNTAKVSIMKVMPRKR